MTKRLCAGVALAWLAAWTSLSAADVWESKPFNTWTDKELQKVLTSSPWAGKAGITYVKQQANQRPIFEEALVTWASSRVMRQALAREEYGATADVSKEAQGVIAQSPTFYMVTVKLTKAVSSANHARRASEMKNETFLVVRGKPPIPATQAEGQVLDVAGTGTKTEAPPGSGGRGGGPPAFAASPAQRGGGGGTSGGGTSGGGQPAGSSGRSTGPPQTAGRNTTTGRGNPTERPTTASLVIFRFPRDPITLEDKEVEFVTRLCGTGGGFGGAPTSAAPPSGVGGPGAPPQFELAAGAQRGGGGGGGTPAAGTQGGQPVRMGDPLPTCNQQVKKTFKLKDMTVKGELQL